MNYRSTSGTLGALIFDNRFTRELPADPINENRPRQVMGACYSRVKPTRVSTPKLVAYSREVAELLDISEDTCDSSHFSQVFAGNRLLKSMDPFAMCYGGHQFGRWAGQLGDGREPIHGDPDLVALDPFWNPGGKADDGRQAHPPLEQAELRPPVGARAATSTEAANLGGVPVVAHEHDQGVVSQPELLQGPDDLADQLVHRRDEGCVHLSRLR